MKESIGNRLFQIAIRFTVLQKQEDSRNPLGKKIQKYFAKYILESGYHLLSQCFQLSEGQE